VTCKSSLKKKRALWPTLAGESRITIPHTCGGGKHYWLNSVHRQIHVTTTLPKMRVMWGWSHPPNPSTQGRKQHKTEGGTEAPSVPSPPTGPAGGPKTNAEIIRGHLSPPRDSHRCQAAHTTSWGGEPRRGVHLNKRSAFPPGAHAADKPHRVIFHSNGHHNRDSRSEQGPT
jgi:hypothetical protein